MNALTNQLSPFAIVIIVTISTIFIAAVTLAIIIRNKYHKIYKDFSAGKETGEDKFESKVLTLIVKNYIASAKKNLEEINTQAIIEKHFAQEHRFLLLGERFVKHSISLMIILGLLGTFYGLTLSIDKLGELLTNGNNIAALDSMDTIVNGLIASLKGMSVAFITSLFGIAGSILITIVNIAINIEEKRETLMIEIEEFLDNTVSLDFINNKQDDYRALVESLENIFGQYTAKMDDNYKIITNSLTDNLSAAAREMESTSLAILKTVQQFDKSISTFVENTRDFSQFNYELRTNIERMNVTFADFTSDMKAAAKVFSNKQG
ncbi:MotA/TolQ/ExbB proton channel family protein [Petroclostridium sp. X23]|uniref:MotA/TolQ/ExbB proton channel family protein n=1 Tax=Petroclostridium sp. X23 TaxID=3045146 RepID=UPI0024AE6048|nr:MotA/TolQ/ExbB proton channel family protein [Petroclostridium sp. X23]WHH58527.1 MotA/TolQ/ExbB proton channel family protein [Petroclostridium sp. X23]